MSERLLDPSVLAAIGRLDLIARTVVEGFLIGLHKSPYHGLSHEFAEHRPYIAGDEFRRVDWRVYGRTDRLFVKEFDEETNVTVHFLFDASGSLAFTPREVSKFDYGRYLVAAFAYLAIRQNDRIGLVCFDESARERVATRGGRRHLHAIFAALDRVRPAGRTNVGSTLLREAAQWKRRGLVILVSDLYDDREVILDAVARVRRVGHDVIVFHLLDAAEKLLSQRGTFEFYDLETGETVVADTARIRKGYIQRLDEQRGYFKREFERTGAEYVEIDTSQPLDKALSIYLRRRKGRRGKG
jgi:uncharacterized protein (DUF58 family)